MTAASARQQVEKQLNEQDFLKDPVLTSDTLLKDKEGSNESNPLKDPSIPQNYQRATKAPLILGVLSLLLGVAVFFLSDTKRQGAKSLARTLAIVGGSLLVITLVASMLFDRLFKPGGPVIKDAGDSLQRSIADVVNSLSDKFNHTVLVYALVYVVIGGGSLLAIKFLWKQTENTVVARSTPKVPKA
jgi:hypothetical protein